jgi:asparagine synthase (glutamine-hydrolysing)
MINFKLFGNQAFSWVEKDNQYFTGYFFDDNNVFFNGENALRFFKDKDSDIPKLNGIYTFIKTTPDGIVITTDTINYFPIFYVKQNEDWFVSDDWNFLTEMKGGLAPHLEAREEFESIGFVLDNETLDADILKTRAGEKLLLNHDGTAARVPDYYFLPQSFSEGSLEKFYNELTSELYEAGRRLVQFLDARTAVIPLSGGFDSRLIVCILKKLNYENVICFTYGVKNKEEKISRKVAQNLGFQWFFIDYSEIDIETYLDDSQFLEYMRWTGNGYAMPYLQEYFAVKKLVKDNLIPENSVFLPGHIGGLAGAQILKSVKTKKQNHELFNNLINNYFFFKKISKKKQLIKRIAQTTRNYPSENKYSKNYNPYVEDWILKEKFSKFIFHSSKVFDFWGHETYFLLWDKKMVNFFRNLPYPLRENKLLYDKVAINEFFIKLNVYFQEAEIKVTPFAIKIQKLKSKIRDLFPWSYILKRMEKQDWMYYAAFTSMMENRLEEKGYQRLKHFRLYNAIICRWYLDFVGFLKLIRK